MHTQGTADASFAQLSPEQLSRLQNVEREINAQAGTQNEVILLAYNKTV